MKKEEAKQMTRRINLEELDKNVRQFFQSLNLGGEEYILEVGGKPKARLVPAEEVELREYSQKEIEEFLKEDKLDKETLARAKELLGEKG